MVSRRRGSATLKWRSAALRSVKCTPTRLAPTVTALTRRALLIFSCGWSTNKIKATRFCLMASYQILYWQDIPSQVKAWDDFDDVKVELAPRFAARIDQTAQSLGLTQTDDY